MSIDGDWERGRVWFKRLRTEERVITIYRRANSSSSELVYTGELIQGWDEDFAALWIEAMDEANLRDRVPVSTCFRGTWRAFLWGRQRQKNGARSKQAKEFEKFLRDLGRDHCWSILCMQEFTSSNGELVTETTEGHREFATPPCPGQRRLAIVVAAACAKCIVNSSSRVRGRNCSIDVCWERKKFRVICSHLNPGSVMHMYARDLGDLSMLVTSPVKDAHVHVCVDAQTGLVHGY